MTAADSPPWSPELPAVESYEQTFMISERVSYVQRFDLDERDRLTEWAVVQLARTDTGYRRVAAYDACHGKGVHVHRYDNDEVEFSEETIKSINSYEDMEEGLQYAVTRVVQSWQENERRSARGR